MNPTPDYLAQLRTLAEAFSACVEELRTLHEHYLTLQGAAVGRERERREKLLQHLHAEQDVLTKTLRIQQQIDACLRMRREWVLYLDNT